MLSLLPALFCAGLITSSLPQSKTDLLESPYRHVRTTNLRVRYLLEMGVRRSATFASLLARLNASDVIVYIEQTDDMPKTLEGRLMLLPLANHQRYLRIQINRTGTPTELISLMGHELRHAIEVADATDVRDERALERLYQRIGMPSAALHTYDTDAAQTTGRRVRKELLT
ncbi:MAG: hypothetical protein DMF84_17625 [Acidobacteria bacterium]|nr:MAG: hypothetical protein DMF84_17625 [Acidobacteriota bacterium]